MFCSEPLLESIFGAQNGDLYSKSRFWKPFRISRGSENDPRGDHFGPKGLQRTIFFTGRGDLEPTLRPVTPKTAPRTPFLQFGIDFGLILVPFLMELGSIWDDHLGICRKLLVTCFEFV